MLEVLHFFNNWWKAYVAWRHAASYMYSYLDGDKSVIVLMQISVWSA